MAAGALLLVVVGVGLAIPVGLWVLVERETENRPVSDRRAAERQVRHDDGEAAQRDGATEDEWGGNDKWGRE